MNRIRVGIVGAGNIVKYHCAGFKEAGAEIAAVVDVNRNAAESFAKENKIPFVAESIPEMLKTAGKVNAVSIAVPNFLHKSLAVEAMKCGLNVFCEKPPALSAAEVEEMREVEQETGKVLMFDFNNRARHEAKMIRSYIADGMIGTIRSTQAVWIRRNGIPGFGAWFTNKKLSGGGPVIDLIHMIDLSLYFMGYPEPAYVLASTFKDFIDSPDFMGPWQVRGNGDGGADVESSCHAFIRFKSGQCLEIRNAWAEMNERECISVTFQGSKAGGCIKRLFEVDGVDETSKDICSLYTVENGYHVNREMIIPKDESMGRIACAENFIDVLAGKAKPLSNSLEAFRLMKIVDAIYKSAETGRPVEM